MPAVGTAVRVAIYFLDGQHAVTLEAAVVRHEAQSGSEARPGAAVRFEPMSRLAAAELDLLIATILKGPGGDRRARPRVAALLRVHCRTDSELDAVTQDISAGGIGLVCEQVLAVGDRVEVEIRAPSGSQLPLWARVRRVKPPGPNTPQIVGLEFEGLSEASRSDLERLLEELAKA